MVDGFFLQTVSYINGSLIKKYKQGTYILIYTLWFILLSPHFTAVHRYVGNNLTA